MKIGRKNLSSVPCTVNRVEMYFVTRPFLICGIISLLVVSVVVSAEPTQPVEVRISTNEVKWRISKYLLGMHFVYAHEQDSIYADGRIAQWARQVNVGVVRYPGGSVATVHVSSTGTRPGAGRPKRS